ncbi:MAG TPA: GAP family protein, partial [Candidatus Bilamarchaeaceae archaeon]|nr:GAP family protein [Candidatus Bilamarchaeaceae archaeon]
LSGKKVGKVCAFLLGGAVVALGLAFLGFAAGSGMFSEMGITGLPASLDMGLGVVFIIFAARGLLEKEGGRKGRVEGAKGGAFKWFAIGFLANFTNADAVVLNFTAVKEVFAEGAGFAFQLLMLGVADFFFLSPALVPLLAYAVAPEKAAKLLEPVGAWMRKCGRYVVAAIFAIFGAYLLMKGVSG